MKIKTVVVLLLNGLFSAFAGDFMLNNNNRRTFCKVDAGCGTGRYCLNDPTKMQIPVYHCHGYGDSDCPADSYCMGGEGKAPAPYMYMCKSAIIKQIFHPTADAVQER